MEAGVGGGDNPVGEGDSDAHSSPLLFVKKAHLEKQDCDSVCAVCTAYYAGSNVCKASEERKSCIPHLKSSYPETYHMENLAITFVQSPQHLEPSGQISLKCGLG